MCNKKEVTSLPPKLTVTSFNLLGTNRLPIAPPISIVSIAQSREKVNIGFYVPDSTVLGFSPSQVHRFHLSGISANLLVFESVCAAVRRLLSVCDGTCLPVFSGSLFTFCEETRNPLQSQGLCATMSTAHPSSSGQRAGKVAPPQTLQFSSPCTPKFSGSQIPGK